MSITAVIGGTGLNQLPGLELIREHVVTTPYGEPSAPILEGRIAAQSVFFLPRHGNPHRLPPHKINYRANLWGLRELGVEQIIGMNAVGGVQGHMGPGTLAVPDQIIDYTWGREHTYYDGSAATHLATPLEHIDFTWPYDASLRAALLEAAAFCEIPCEASATYGATQGPRLESAAEVKRLLRDGCDLVGMTGMPEAALAAELGLAYAAISLVVNAAAGITDTPITEPEMRLTLEQKTPAISAILARFLQLPR